jgi:hypothetical protein
MQDSASPRPVVVWSLIALQFLLGLGAAVSAAPRRWPQRINPFRRAHWSWAGSLAAGVILLIWITVQMLMLQAVAFLHVLHFGCGIALILLALVPGVRRHYTLQDHRRRATGSSGRARWGPSR